MTVRIGVDLDHTIACYDKNLGGTKESVKKALLEQPDGEFLWQKLQGEIYGKLMHRAELYPGVDEFFELARFRDAEVVIVSHKSKYGHYDDSKTPLRTAALEWLQKNNISCRVYFEETRSEKAKRIALLNPDYFIDDLKEVFEEPSFPKATKKILFQPTKNTWRMISRQIFGEWKPEEILALVQSRFSELRISNIVPVFGRQNSRVYRLSSPTNDYALKIYPDLGLDSRPRLETEYQASMELSNRSLPVLRPISKNGPLNWAVYDWVNGEAPNPSEQFIDQAVNLVRQLAELSKRLKVSNLFTGASEHCLEPDALLQQIDARFECVKAKNNAELRDFLNRFEKTYLKMKRVQKGDVALGVLSPSDLGVHNAILKADGNYTFIDLEYFGWDDPVKLVSDFYWHPAMELGAGLRERWLKNVMPIFSSEQSFVKRFEQQLSLYGLRWSLIVLNQINPAQISKADRLLREVENGPTL